MLPISARLIQVFIAIAALALLGGALVLQHFYGLNPCPLCIFQRIAFILVALLSIGAALLGSRHAARWFGAAAALFSLVGAGIAAWHLRLLAQPEKLACGPQLSDMLDNFPLTHVLPRVFAGSGDCATAGEPIFGMPLAAWALLWFLFFALASIGALARR
jgi:disulfide bond formation protein DsbB